uniref:ANK_REP_REGION domain-containing protein n=1 Tax=Macrostomum lignano TaxID=282301 RepID=A0A1I8IQG6_9PLAT
MAVMNKDLELVKLLVKCGAVIDQRAVGDFFRPEDQRQVNKAAITDYRYPLAFACCVGSAEIYDFLLSCGAHPDSKDQFGNSVLHMLVIHNNTEIYRLAVKHHKKPANPKLTNSAGLNPISLAAKLGRKDVFNEIIDLSSSEMWRFANITCKVYPLTGVDTIGQSGRTDWNSAFMYIINGPPTSTWTCLSRASLTSCCTRSGRNTPGFLQRLLMLTIHIIIMSAAIYLRPLKSSSDTSATSSSLESDNSSLTTTASSVASTTTAAAAAVTISTQEVFRYVFECITVVNSLVTLFMHIDEVREQGVLDFLRGLVS